MCIKWKYVAVIHIDLWPTYPSVISKRFIRYPQGVKEIAEISPKALKTWFVRNTFYLDFAP